MLLLSVLKRIYSNMKRINKLIKSLRVKIPLLNKKRKEVIKKTFNFIQRKPFTAFFAVLIIFLILMVVGNVLFSPKATVDNTAQAPKQVKIYKLGSAPQVSYQGKVEKSGVIKIVAQSGGVVSAINVYEGQQIGKGTNILSLSSNYQGGNALSIARQIAQNQYQSAKDNFNTQGDIIGRQKDLANKSNDNLELLRQIANQSASDTSALADLDKTIVDSISSNIGYLEQTNVNGSNDAAILQAKEQLVQFQSAMVQTNASLRNLQLQGSSTQPPSEIAKQQHDIAVAQLDLQRKALDLNLEISRLSYNLSLVNEATMFPVSPFSGTVDKIYVHLGENVNPGTLLASISGFNQHVEVVVSVDANIAKNISVFEPSVLYIGNKSINMMPSYVSKDATNGVLYSVIYDLDDSMASNLTNLSYINVLIPIGTADTTNADPFIPLDSVAQTQEEAYVYVVDNKNIARVKKITLGQIQGRFVEVLSGLPKDAQVILDRNVIEGDRVSILR